MSRCVLVSVMLLACGAARADDAEDKALKLVEKLGSKVIRFETKEGKQVVQVDLRFTKVNDADLEELAALTSLTTLNLWETDVSDVGVKELSALKWRAL